MTKRRRHSNVHGRGGHEDKRMFQPSHNGRLRPIRQETDSDTDGIFIFLALLAVAFIIAKFL